MSLEIDNFDSDLHSMASRRVGDGLPGLVQDTIEVVRKLEDIISLKRHGYNPIDKKAIERYILIIKNNIE